MNLARRAALPPAVLLAVAAAACAGHTVKSTASVDSSGRDLIALLPDPDTGVVGRAVVSNASGTVDLSQARAATYVGRNQPPSPAAALSEAEARDVFGAALSALPQAPEHFTLNFLFDSDELTPESRAIVPTILQAVKKRAVPDVLVLGHTDTTGPASNNIALGLKRAALIRKLLVDSGLNASLIEIGSHGEADLLVKTADEVAEPRNRRVEITVR